MSHPEIVQGAPKKIHKKVSYQGLAKNRARMFSLVALANLVIAKRPLMRAVGVGAS